MAIGNTTATNGASTLIIDVTNTYQTVSLENQGSSKVWLAWGEAAALNQGISLSAAGTDGDVLVLPLSQGKFPLKMYAWADGTNCNIAWHTFSR